MLNANPAAADRTLPSSARRSSTRTIVRTVRGELVRLCVVALGVGEREEGTVDERRREESGREEKAFASVRSDVKSNGFGRSVGVGRSVSKSVTVKRSSAAVDIVVIVSAGVA